MTTKITGRDNPNVFIVTKSEAGEDRVWAGVVDGVHTWTLQPEKMMQVSTALGLELLRDFVDADHGDGPQLVTGHKILGPRVVCGSDRKTYVLGC